MDRDDMRGDVRRDADPPPDDDSTGDAAATPTTLEMPADAAADDGMDDEWNMGYTPVRWVGVYRRGTNV